MIKTTSTLPVVTIAPTGKVTSVNLSKTYTLTGTTTTKIKVSSTSNNSNLYEYEAEITEITEVTKTNNGAATRASSDDGNGAATITSNNPITIFANAQSSTTNTVISATSTDTTTILTSNSKDKSAMFCIRRSCSKYKRRRPSLGDNNGGSMREIITNRGIGNEGFDQSSFSSEMSGGGFSSSNNRNLMASNIVNSAEESPVANSYYQGIPNDITDDRNIIITENDDPFSDAAFVESTSSPRNALPSHQLYQHSDVMEKFEARKLPKIKTPSFVEAFLDDGESPSTYSNSFNFYSDPFQNNEYSPDEEVEPRPMLRPSLSRIPTVISAFNELIDPFPLPPLESSVSDTNNNVNNNNNTNVIGSATVNTPDSELSPFDDLISACNRREGGSTESSPRSIPVIGKVDMLGMAESKSLARELSTALTISSAIESTALPILSTHNSVFEESNENVITKFSGGGGVMDRSRNNTEGSQQRT